MFLEKGDDFPGKLFSISLLPAVIFFIFQL